MVITLSSEEIDVPVTVSVQLFDRFGSPLPTTTPSVSGFTYTATSTISSFERNHSGNYSCTAIVISSNNNSFLVDSDTSSSVTRVTVGEGIHLPRQMQYYYLNL